MIKVDYSERFLKDLKKLKKHDVYSRIKEVCFDELENYDDLDSVRSLKKIKGFSNYNRNTSR